MPRTLLGRRRSRQLKAGAAARRGSGTSELAIGGRVLRHYASSMLGPLIFLFIAVPITG